MNSSIPDAMYVITDCSPGQEAPNELSVRSAAGGVRESMAADTVTQRLLGFTEASKKPMESYLKEHGAIISAYVPEVRSGLVCSSVLACL